MAKPREVFAVAWIEVEFGQRPEGYKIFTTEEECIKSTIESSKKGGGGGMYYGPERPLTYVKVPWTYLPKKIKDRLKEHSTAHTENRWHPEMSSSATYIKDPG
jgi:hypothetical protein